MKKLMLAITIILSVLFTGCYSDSYGAIDISFDSFSDMAEWVSHEIEYKYDVLDEWQSPEETYRLRTGDCEDMAFLASYFLKQLGISHEIVVLKTKESIETPVFFHMLIYLNNINKYYSPGERYSGDPESFLNFFHLYYSHTLQIINLEN